MAFHQIHVFYKNLIYPQRKTTIELGFFQFYSAALKEFISRSPEWLTTINATEGGSIFGDSVVCKKFKEFLLDVKN